MHLLSDHFAKTLLVRDPVPREGLPRRSPADFGGCLALGMVEKMSEFGVPLLGRIFLFLLSMISLPNWQRDRELCVTARQEVLSTLPEDSRPEPPGFAAD